MTRANRTVQLLGLAVGPAGRARFVEEWQSDVAAARAVGLSRSEIVLAAARVAAFLLRIRLRAWVLRRHDRGELVAEGVLLGILFTVADVPLDVFVPFLLLAIGWWVWRRVRAWIDGGA